MLYSPRQIVIVLNVANDYLQHKTLKTNCEKNMNSQNPVQIFTSASLGMGYNSAFEIAEQIKLHTNSKFLPLANAGPFSDISDQDKAAEQFGLTPVYARTLGFNKREETVVILAKNNGARVWLNRQPINYDSLRQLEDNILSTNHDDITVFIPNTWLNDKEMGVFAKRLRSDCDAVLLWDVRTPVNQPKEELARWDIIPSLPIHYASDEYKEAFDSLRSAIRAKETLQPGMHIQAGGCFYSDEEYLKNFGNVIASLPVSGRNLESIFNECETTPVNLHHEMTIPEWLADESSAGTLKSKAGRALIEFIQRNELGKDVADTYQSRLTNELSLIESKGLSAKFLRTLEVFSARGDGLLLMRGPQVNCLIFHLFGMTNVDPVAHNLSEYLYFSKLKASPSPLLRIDFDSSENARSNVDTEMMKVHKGKYVGGIYVHKMVIKTALRSVAKHPKYKADRLIKRELDQIADSIPFQHKDMSVQELADNYPAAARLLESEPEVKKILEHLLNQNCNISLLTGLRTIFDSDSMVYAPSSQSGVFFSMTDPQTPINIIGMSKEELDQVPSFQFNLLGLKAFNWIEAAIKDPKIDIAPIDDIRLNEERVFESMRINGLGIFHFESELINESVKSANITSIEDMAALLSLHRPGPLEIGLLESFIQQRGCPVPSGLEENQTLSGILEETRGVPVFQEQFFDILTKIGGLSPERAVHWVRTPSAVQTESGAEELYNELKEMGLSRSDANAIIDFIETPMQYAFSKGHALAYATIGYYTAWLRHHYLNAWFHIPVNDSITHHKNKLDLLKSLLELGVVIYGVDGDNAKSIKRFTVTNEGWVPLRTTRSLTLRDIKSLELEYRYSNRL